jgi:hypothetical protein
MNFKVSIFITIIFSGLKVTNISAFINNFLSLLKAAKVSDFIKKINLFFIIFIKGVIILEYTLINRR